MTLCVAVLASEGTALPGLRANYFRLFKDTSSPFKKTEKQSRPAQIRFRKIEEDVYIENHVNRAWKFVLFGLLIFTNSICNTAFNFQFRPQAFPESSIKIQPVARDIPELIPGRNSLLLTSILVSSFQLDHGIRMQSNRIWQDSLREL